MWRTLSPTAAVGTGGHCRADGFKEAVISVSVGSLRPAAGNESAAGQDDAFEVAHAPQPLTEATSAARDQRDRNRLVRDQGRVNGGTAVAVSVNRNAFRFSGR